MKKCLAIAAVLMFALISCSMPTSSGSPEIPDAYFDEQPADYSSQYITLNGDWHFKVYRKYQTMFQLGQSVTWENNTDALIPDASTFSAWPTVQGPANDYSTGGLLQLTNDGSTTDSRTSLLATDVFPTWSESWWCREIEIPAAFLTESTVTLHLGIIDDMDVVYINGTPVAASGFKIGSGNAAPAPASNVPLTGGFVPTGAFRFESSYWEKTREYKVDASLFNEGTNELCIRIYNNNSYGGFYDRPLALSATANASRYLKGLPTADISNSSNYAEFINKQINAIESKDIKAYAKTLSSAYHENELDKAKQIAVVQTWFNGYDTITVVDTNNGFFVKNNRACYTADRIITGVKDGTPKILFDKKDYEKYFSGSNANITEKGNYSRCYSVTYNSILVPFNTSTRKMIYSVYLPASYYTNTSKKYPVVYLLHGINSTGQSFINVDRIQDKMDVWIKSGSIKEMIVIMPDSGKSSGYKDTSGAISEAVGPWESHITEDILFQVESNYRVKNSKNFRGLTGISMGGGGAFRIGLRHPDKYSSIASHMGAVGNETLDLIDALSPADLAGMDFYLDCGIADTMVDWRNTEAVGQRLEERGANVEWRLKSGGHNSAFYMSGMEKSMKMHSKHFVKNGY